jgi:asparagine synthase (glutamine-hydrolysing)
MCGIAGAISPRGIDPSLLVRLGDALEHRGPDGEGYLLGPGDGPLTRFTREQLGWQPGGAAQVGFAHRRLTIIDLSERSDQPLVDAAGRLAIAYNGELYNYIELRKELEDLGHSFTSTGDTEVVLAAYRQWGPESVERFVGMWALAILDVRRHAVFLSRDRFGIKPLFHARVGETLYFASEIKALLEVPGLRVEPDEEVLRRYLLDGVVDNTERTFFRGITRLPPAHNLLVSLDGPLDARPTRYWSYPAQNGRVQTGEAAERLRSLLEDAVRIHARSDVPVGTCLSGGLDSSTIVCLAEELRAAGEIPRYTHSAFGYLPQDQAFSERKHMEAVAQQTGARMFFVDTDVDRFTEKLLEIVRQQDEPFGSTSIAAQWFVFEAAKREGMKVMLDGQGADEVLGGYHGYFPVIASNLIRNRRLLSYARFHREHKELLGHGPLPVRGAVWSALPERARRQVSRRARVPLPPGARLMSAPLRERVRTQYQPSPPASLHELLQGQTESVSLPSLLRYEDRNSMAHSLEARVPILDHRVVEFAFQLPDELKVNGVETKYLLREAMKGVIPEEVRARRDKVGFRAEPRATWLLAERHRDSLLANRTGYEERWLDSGALAAAIDGSDRSTDTEFMVWRAINAKLWLRQHFSDLADPLGPQ